MHNVIDVAIIGAGPYALSLAAHLKQAGIEFRIFGKTMESWKTRMPQGMLLKSHPWASSLYDPFSSLTLKQFCQDKGYPYHDYLISIPLETFISYGNAFQTRFAPTVENKYLESLELSKNGFLAIFDDGEIIEARQVVICVGVHPFKYIPSPLSGLSSEHCTHSSEYGSLEGLTGKKVAVVGLGASAIDLAALLSLKGIETSLIGQSTHLNFMPTPEAKKSSFARLRHLASPLKPVRRLLNPNSCIGSTWLLKLCAEAPYLFYKLPEATRINIAQNELGPSGHWAMKDIIQDNVSLRLGRKIASAALSQGKLDILLKAIDGQEERLQADHLIAATGYKIDLTKLSFLRKILHEIKTVQGAPLLNISYESSLPGLYFIGPASMNSFGPVTRFVCGANHAAKSVTQHLRRQMQKPYTTDQRAISSSKQPPNILLIATMFRTPYRTLRCAQSAGAKVFVLGNDSAKGLQTSRYCQAFMHAARPICGEFDADLAEQINHISQEHGIDLILAGDALSTRSLIAMREHLKSPCFPMPDLKQFDLLNNKWKFYQLCRSLDIKTPQSQLFDNAKDLMNEIHWQGYPKIVKPIDKESNQGVIKVTQRDIQKNMNLISYSPILLQDFIEGEDVGASVLCKNGQITTFVAHAYHRYVYAAFFHQSIYNDLKKIVEFLKLEGIFNFDMRRTPDGQIYYLECNPRVFWKISMSMLAGINFISAGLSDANQNNPLPLSTHPILVQYPQSTMLYALTAPWKLNESSWNVLKYLFRDPIPYLRELCGMEKDLVFKKQDHENFS